MTEVETGNAAAKAAQTWYGIAVMLGIGLAVISFVAFGYAYPSVEVAPFSAATTAFNPTAGFLGALGAMLLYLPWIGVFHVLRELAERK